MGEKTPGNEIHREVFRGAKVKESHTATLFLLLLIEEAHTLISKTNGFIGIEQLVT